MGERPSQFFLPDEIPAASEDGKQIWVSVGDGFYRAFTACGGKWIENLADNGTIYVQAES